MRVISATAGMCLPDAVARSVSDTSVGDVRCKAANVHARLIKYTAVGTPARAFFIKNRWWPELSTYLKSPRGWKGDLFYSKAVAVAFRRRVFVYSQKCGLRCFKPECVDGELPCVTVPTAVLTAPEHEKAIKIAFVNGHFYSIEGVTSRM